MSLSWVISAYTVFFWLYHEPDSSLPNLIGQIFRRFLDMNEDFDPSHHQPKYLTLLLAILFWILLAFLPCLFNFTKSLFCGECGYQSEICCRYQIIVFLASFLFFVTNFLISFFLWPDDQRQYVAAIFILYVFVEFNWLRFYKSVTDEAFKAKVTETISDTSNVSPIATNDEKDISEDLNKKESEKRKQKIRKR